MRVVYEPEIVGRLNKAVCDATNAGKTIARFEVNPYEMNELKKWFDKQSYSFKTKDIDPKIGIACTYMGIPVVEHPFTYFAALPLEENTSLV